MPSPKRLKAKRRIELTKTLSYRVSKLSAMERQAMVELMGDSEVKRINNMTDIVWVAWIDHCIGQGKRTELEAALGQLESNREVCDG